MLGAQELLAGDAVHALCPLLLEDDVAYTSGVLNAPPQVFLAAKSTTVEVHELSLTGCALSTPSSFPPCDPAAPLTTTTEKFRSLGHVVDFGCAVLAMVGLSHQCVAVWTAEQDFIVLRYQANLGGGREDLIGYGPSCAVSLENLKKGIACSPSPVDWTAEAGQHWQSLHHRLHWMLVYSGSLITDQRMATEPRPPCANPHLALLSRGLCNVVLAHAYEGCVHRIAIRFHAVLTQAQLAERTKSLFGDGVRRQQGPPPAGVLENFYSDRWTGLNVAAEYTANAFKTPQPYTSGGLDLAVAHESSEARRSRLLAQWASFSYQDIADEELLLQKDIASLALQKAELAHHLPSWRVVRDTRLPTITMELTPTRTACGTPCVLPIPGLHGTRYPDALFWLLYHPQKAHLTVYRHPTDDPSRLQTFQKPGGRAEGSPVYLAIAVPAPITAAGAAATRTPATQTSQVVLFHHTPAGVHRVRVEDLDGFRIGLDATTGTVVAACKARAVSALLVASTRVLWVSLDDGDLSCFPLPASCTAAATQTDKDVKPFEDCEERPWPASPPVRGLPRGFRTRRMRPLDLDQKPSQSDFFFFASTPRYAIFEDELAEVLVVDLIKAEVVAGLRSRGAMTDICEGMNGSLLTAHVNGCLERITAVTPTMLLARLHAPGAHSQSRASGSGLPSSSSSLASLSSAPALPDATDTGPAEAVVDDVFPLLLRSQNESSDTALHVLVSLSTGQSVLYRCTFDAAATGEAPVLRELEVVSTPTPPAMALIREAATLAAAAMPSGQHLVQCTPSQLNAFGTVVDLDSSALHAALAPAGDDGCVAAVVCEARPATVWLHALSAAPPTTQGQEPFPFALDGAVSALSVAATTMPSSTTATSALEAPVASVTWVVCVVSALWSGRVQVHLALYDATCGWRVLSQRVLHHPPFAAGTPHLPRQPCAVPLVVHQLVPVAGPSQDGVATESSCALWALQWAGTALCAGGGAATAQLFEVGIALRTVPQIAEAQWLCMPPADGPGGLAPPAQIAAPVLPLTLHPPGTTCSAGAVTHRQPPRHGGLHLALLHECYAELMSLGSATACASAAPGTVAEPYAPHHPRPVASLRVDAQPLVTATTPAPSMTRWRSCAVVECAAAGDGLGDGAAPLTHLLFTANSAGGLAVVGLPDILIPCAATTEPAWELSVATPTCYRRTQYQMLPAVGPSDALVRLLPAVPVADLRGSVALSEHICCVDRGPHERTLLVAVCPQRLEMTDAVMLTHCVNGSQRGGASVTLDLIATCMERVTGHDGHRASADVVVPPPPPPPGAGVILVGAHAITRPGTRTTTTEPAHARDWLLVVATSPLRIITALPVPVTALEDIAIPPTPGITDLAVYCRPAATPRATEAAGPEPCVLVVVTAGTSVLLYRLQGTALIALSKVRCSAVCTSVAFAYPCISVGLGGDGFAFLWVLSLTESGNARRPKLAEQTRETAADSDAEDESSDEPATQATTTGSGAGTGAGALHGHVSLRSPHSIDDLNAILHRSDTRDALDTDLNNSTESDDEEEDAAALPAEPAYRDDGTTPFSAEDERRKRVDQSKLATLQSEPSGLSLVVGAYEPAVLSGSTRQRSYRERFVRVDDRGGVFLDYPHPPTSLTEMDQRSVGVRGGTSAMMTHCVCLPSPATAVTVASPLSCRAVRRVQPRALQWCERWVALCAAGTGPRAILLPCVDGGLRSLTEVPYALAHPLLRLEQILTDARTYCLETHAGGADEDVTRPPWSFTYHTRPYLEELAIRSATRLSPKQGVVGLDALRAFFACSARLHEGAWGCPPDTRTQLAIQHTEQMLKNVLREEYGNELTLADCIEMTSSI